MIRKGSALIRAAFGVDPYLLSDREWAQLLAEAVWLEQRKTDVLITAIKTAFGGKKK